MNENMTERQCQPWTAECYPDKMTVEEFYAQIFAAKESFIANMHNLPSIPKTQWAEDWMETLQSWIEMKKPRD